jgi:hypothetical protein
MNESQKWKEAHSGIEVGDDSLAVMAPFPSLYANAFITLLESRGDDPQIVEFIRGIHREMVWAYDNWAKVQRDSNPALLLLDLLNNASGGPPYDFVAKFISDYAKANNISLRVGNGLEPAWFAVMKKAEDLTDPVVDLLPEEHWSSAGDPACG